ncbi:MAG: hypothetical protein ACRENG_28540, partial [bacterium]
SYARTGICSSRVKITLEEQEKAMRINSGRLTIEAEPMSLDGPEIGKTFCLMSTSISILCQRIY